MRNSRERVRRNSRRERIQRRRPMQKAYYQGGVQEDIWDDITDRVAGIYIDTFFDSWRRANQEARDYLKDWDDFLDLNHFNDPDEPLFDPDEYGWEADDPDEYEDGIPVDFDWNEFVDMVINSVEGLMPDILKERLFS